MPFASAKSSGLAMRRREREAQLAGSASAVLVVEVGFQAADEVAARNESLEGRGGSAAKLRSETNVNLIKSAGSKFYPGGRRHGGEVLGRVSLNRLSHSCACHPANPAGMMAAAGDRGTIRNDHGVADPGPRRWRLYGSR